MSKETITFPNGDVYEGETRNGSPHGKGKLTEAVTGFAYEGDFAHGRRHGRVKFIDEEGCVVNEGNWESGRYIGTAEIGQGGYEVTSVLSPDDVDRMIDAQYGDGAARDASRIPAQVGALSGDEINRILDNVSPSSAAEKTDRGDGGLSQDTTNAILDAVDETLKSSGAC